MSGVMALFVKDGQKKKEFFTQGKFAAGRV